MNSSNILKIEAHAFEKIFDVLNDHHFTGKYLLVTDQHLDILYGSIVKEQLSRLGQLQVVYSKDNSISYAMELATYVIENEIDFVVGLGGGRILDVCKYAFYVAKKTYIALPTTLANDGIASPIAVLKVNSGKVKSLGAAMAKVIIIDTTVMAESPLELIKAGIGDTISNYMALIDWDLACRRKKDTMHDFAYLMSKESLNALINTKYEKIDESFIEVLANSIVLSGIAMQYAGTSRPVSGSEHLFSHALDFYCDLNNLHGLQVALGTITMLKLLKLDYKDILMYLKKFEVNINPKHLNISESDFILCMKKAVTMRSNRYTHLNEIKLEDDELKKIYQELLEEL